MIFYLFSILCVVIGIKVSKKYRNYIIFWYHTLSFFSFEKSLNYGVLGVLLTGFDYSSSSILLKSLNLLK